MKKSKLSVMWLSHQFGGSKVRLYCTVWLINIIEPFPWVYHEVTFVFAWQIAYAGGDVVQLRFLRLHSYTSFQHMTVSCTANQFSGTGTANLANWTIHVMGDSGKEIIPHFTRMFWKDCGVSLKVLAVGFCLFYFLKFQLSVLSIWNEGHWLINQLKFLPWFLMAGARKK